MDKIKELQQRERDLYNEYKAASEQTLQAIRMHIEKIYGVKPGSIVCGASSSRKGKLFKVVEVDASSQYYSANKPWLKCNPQRKDGSFGTQIININNWELYDG
jgi:hypothetical protein